LYVELGFLSQAKGAWFDYVANWKNSLETWSMFSIWSVLQWDRRSQN